MNRFYVFGLLLLLALTLASCHHIRMEDVPIYWLYPWDRDARRMARAVIKEDVEQIDEIVQSGKVDVNMASRDDIVLFPEIAIFRDKKQSFVKLLDLGADIYREDAAYYAAGYFAEVAGDLYYLEEVLKRGLDPNARLTIGSRNPIFSPWELRCRTMLKRALCLRTI